MALSALLQYWCMCCALAHELQSWPSLGLFVLQAPMATELHTRYTQ